MGISLETIGDNAVVGAASVVMKDVPIGRDSGRESGPSHENENPDGRVTVDFSVW
mgnify:CR=1 FL=1